MPRLFRRSERKRPPQPEQSVLEAVEHEELPALNTVYEGEQPAVDIVAVHGLNGHAFKTYTTNTTQKFWLGDKDMLPNSLPNSRILSFTYPASVAKVFGSTSSSTILENATTLAQELDANRLVYNATQRPIIFICHSLGGIIVKRALSYSESRQSQKTIHAHSIYLSTYGLLFFGTPHFGSSKANLALSVQRMVHAMVPSKVIDTDSRLLNSLKEGSEILQDITDNFHSKMRQFRVFYFWEMEKTDLGVKWDYIVTENSAAPILGDIDRAGIRADHRNMCKFASVKSPGYALVVATLLRYSKEAPGIIERRWMDAEYSFALMRKREATELTQGRVVSCHIA